jgi:hypothetical protein
MKNKNIHVLPTDKPSRLGYLTKKGKEVYKDLRLFEKPMPIILDSENQNIYITSDEEIEKGYVISYGVVIKVMMFDKETLYFVNGTKAKREQCKKIILTTDQDLIKDGVQAIDDEFLEWFVQNPSCELIEIGKTNKLIDNYAEKDEDKWEVKYHIYIPKEEPDYTALLKPVGTKQETLEEVAERYVDSFEFGIAHPRRVAIKSFINGAKWQQEQIGNSEFLQKLRATLSDAEARRLIFEQFKNK